MRCSKYVIIFSILILLVPQRLSALNKPIIFVHGIQNVPKPDISWLSWNNSNSAMSKIANSHYSGYNYGVKLNINGISTGSDLL